MNVMMGKSKKSLIRLRPFEDEIIGSNIFFCSAYKPSICIPWTIKIYQYLKINQKMTPWKAGPEELQYGAPCTAKKWITKHPIKSTMRRSWDSPSATTSRSLLSPVGSGRRTIGGGGMWENIGNGVGKWNEPGGVPNGAPGFPNENGGSEGCGLGIWGCTPAAGGPPGTGTLCKFGSWGSTTGAWPKAGPGTGGRGSWKFGRPGPALPIGKGARQ